MRLERFARFWETIIYIGQSPKAVTLNELKKLYEYNSSHVKTLRRDLKKAITLNLVKELKTHPWHEYKYIGFLSLVQKNGELWCHSCKQFKYIHLFKYADLGYNRYRICKICNRQINKKYYYKNRTFILMKQTKQRTHHK